MSCHLVLFLYDLPVKKKKRKEKMLALHSSLTMVIGVVLSLIIGTLWPHPRPFIFHWQKISRTFHFPAIRYGFVDEGRLIPQVKLGK